MFAVKRPFLLVSSSLLSFCFFSILIPSESRAFSAYRRGDINFDVSREIGSWQAPIRSSSDIPDHDFRVRLTLLDSPIRHVRRDGRKTKLWKAKFNFEATNLAQDKVLTHLRVNGRKISFKTSSSMGVKSGNTIRRNRFVFSKSYDPKDGNFRLTNVKSGWWANNPYGPNDYEKETVPEPFTILGTTMALGFGAFFKKKQKLRQM